MKDYNEIARQLVPINTDKALEKTISDMKNYVLERNKNGILVPPSGGLDSSFVIKVATQALDDEELRFLYMPSDLTNSETPEKVKAVYEDAKQAHLNCIFKEISIAEDLQQNPTYKESIERQKQWSSANSLDKPIAVKIARGDFGNFGALPYIGLTTRKRAEYAVREAEKYNLALASCGNKTEHELNLFIPGAVDDIGDFRPIEGFYKTQIKQLAIKAEVPESILHRTSTPDMGDVTGTDEMYFGASYLVLDAVLYNYEHGKTKTQIIQKLKPFWKRLAPTVHVLRGSETSLEEVVDDTLLIKEWAERTTYEGDKHENSLLQTS